MGASATADIEREGPFGKLSPACALTLAVLATAGHTYIGTLDMPQWLALGVVAAAALGQLKAEIGAPEVWLTPIAFHIISTHFRGYSYQYLPHDRMS